MRLSAAKGKKRLLTGERSGNASNIMQPSYASLRRRRRFSPEHICSLAVFINIKDSGGDNVELELPKDVQDKLAVLQALSDKAENGDKEARRELRRAVRESAPEIVLRASDIGRRGQWALIKTVAADDPLTEEALVGPEPSPLEVLLTERICSLWLLIEVLEMLVSAQWSSAHPPEHRSPVSYLQHVFKWQESANHRFLSAMRELARVRKLQNSNTPAVQFNTQINLEATSSDQRGEKPNR
jgi:hypothetical protein